MKDTSGTSAADLSNALSARTSLGSSTTASESLLPLSAHAQLILEAKNQPGPTLNSLPKISSSKIASTVVLAKMNEPQETQPQQSAEDKLEEMSHTVSAIHQDNTTSSNTSHKDQLDPTIKPLLNFSSPETALMAVHVEVGKKHLVSVDIQSQQSAENGTVACEGQNVG